MLASVSKNLWRLAELAAKLEPKYGEQTLAKFAEEIGLSYKTIENYRRVYRRFGQSQLSGRPDISTLERLIAVPHAEEIIKRHPNITQRQARELAKKERKPPKKEEPTALMLLVREYEGWRLQMLKAFIGHPKELQFQEQDRQMQALLKAL